MSHRIGSKATPRGARLAAGRWPGSQLNVSWHQFARCFDRATGAGDKPLRAPDGSSAVAQSGEPRAHGVIFRFHGPAQSSYGVVRRRNGVVFLFCGPAKLVDRPAFSLDGPVFSFYGSVNAFYGPVFSVCGPVGAARSRLHASRRARMECERVCGYSACCARARRRVVRLCRLCGL